MANIVPVERHRHGSKGWRRLTDFGFVASESVAPITASELSQAVSAMPIGFVEQSGTYMLVVLMAVAKGSNVFVGPSGQWLGNYLPAILRSYPFSMVRGTGGETILGIDEDSGRVVDDVKEADGDAVVRFFEADGTPTQTTKALTDYLKILEEDRAITQRASAALAEADVLKPWPLTVQMGKEQVTVSGLHHVDEKLLNALSDLDFLKLRKAGALVIAYGQLMSARQVNVLTTLATVKAQMSSKAPS